MVALASLAPVFDGEVVTFAEYLAREARSDEKHEYLGGYIYAMSGGTDEHAARAAAIGALLFAHLRGKRCRVYTSDLRIRIQATGLATYPDVSVACGTPEYDSGDPNRTTFTNPRILIEVLSPSTAMHDRRLKLWHYHLIPSVREIVLVAYDRREIEIHSREADDGWRRDIYRAGESARLASIEFDLPVDDVYNDPLA